MSIETIARRYSTALADAVLASGEASTVKSELSALGKLFTESSDLQAVFANPAINHQSKEKVLAGLVAKAKPTKTTGNFLKVLLQNGRLSEIGEINERFAQVLEERSGVISAIVTSARELPVGEKEEIEKDLEKKAGQKVSVRFAVDPNIIGGVVTRIGSTVYDGSVKTKLENLREQLVNG
jgi:F-type H+-transporting ATPase subunit delta